MSEILKPFENKIWLSSPTMHGEEKDYMLEAYNTNWMSTVGKNIDEIEKIASEKIGVKYAVALSSGTSAIHLAIKLAGVKNGDKIFCSDLTFSATVNPIIYENGIPVFIDSEYQTWNMDPNVLEKAFEKYPDVKALVVVHLYGTPAKMDEIQKICNKYNAVIIEDAAEALGASYKGKMCGSFGKVNCISFNGNKIITGSSGGMLLTDDKKMAEKAKKWSTQSRENASWYQHEEIGYNYRMSNVIAGVVRGQFPYLDEHIKQKKVIYERYKSEFKNLPICMNPINEKNCISNYWLSCMLINKEAMCFQRRDDKNADFISEHGKTCPSEILQELAKYNIEGRPIWKPMHLQPVFRKYDFISLDDKSCVSEDIFNRGLCLPSDNKMNESEQDCIIKIIKNIFI